MLKPKRKILRQEIEQDPFIETLFSIKQHFEKHKNVYFSSIAGFIGIVLVISLISRTQTTNNNEASLVLNKAMVFMAQKDNLNAMIFLQEANDKYLNTDAGLDAGYYLGKIHFDRGDYDISQSFFDKYTQDGSNKLLLGASCKALASIYELNNDLNKAIKFQRLQLKYLDSTIDNASANINIAKLSFKLGDKDSAKELIAKVIEKNSGNFEIIQLAEKLNGEILAN